MSKEGERGDKDLEKKKAAASRASDSFLPDSRASQALGNGTTRWEKPGSPEHQMADSLPQLLLC